MTFGQDLIRPAATMALAVVLFSAAIGSAQDVVASPEPREVLAFALRGGMATQSFLGVWVADLTADRSRELKLKDEHGVEVTRIEDVSAAAKAGIKQGDVVLEFNGQQVEGTEQFMRLVRETPAGREVKLVISQNGAVHNLSVAMGFRKSVPFAVGKNGWMNMPEVIIPEMPRVLLGLSSSMLGIEAESLGPQLGEFFGVKEGVLVRSVAKGSAAEKAGMKAGDVLIKVDQTGVASPGDVTSAVRSAHAKRIFPVTVVRNKQEVTLTVTLEGGASGKTLLPRAGRRSVRM